VIEMLDSLKVDWSDFVKAGELTRTVVKDVAADKATLRALVHRVEEDPRLLAMCERHQLLDYLVLYDAADRGFRLRIHISTQDHFDRPHDHRFSFSSYIVRGSYRQTWHEVDRDIYAESDTERARRHMSIQEPDESASGFLADVQPRLVRDETAGSCYTLHHSVVHTTFTTPDTVSVFLRGPAEKERSIIMDRTTGRAWWRYSHVDEPSRRRSNKTMSLDEYRHLVSRLEALDVI